MANDNQGILKSLTLSFNHPIHPRQIQNWRGAFIQMAGWEDELFHNHNNSQEKNGYHYRYPLIQYRVVNGKAAIFAINEGVEALQKVLSKNDWEIEWGGSKKNLQIEDLQMNEHYLRTKKEWKKYRLNKWLALNQKNYELWQNCQGIRARIDLLENILGSNLVSLCKGLNYRPDERIEVQIEEILHQDTVKLHETKVLCFTIIYSSNFLLPAGIGIGKGVALGFGNQMPLRTRIQQRVSNSQHQVSKIKQP